MFNNCILTVYIFEREVHYHDEITLSLLDLKFKFKKMFTFLSALPTNMTKNFVRILHMRIELL